MWLVSGWSGTRGTSVDSFFPGAIWYVIVTVFLPQLALHKVSVPSGLIKQST